MPRKTHPCHKHISTKDATRRIPPPPILPMSAEAAAEAAALYKVNEKENYGVRILRALAISEKRMGAERHTPGRGRIYAGAFNASAGEPLSANSPSPSPL